MRDDDLGLSFFMEDEPEVAKRRTSVFGPVDQDEVIARIDAVCEDDLDSTFFGDSLQEVEDAATRIFDIGIRTFGNVQSPSDQPSAFAPAGGPAPSVDGPPRTGASPPPRVGSEPTASAAGPARPPAVRFGTLEKDPAARRAFVLGGPVALGLG
jgi:hypothetical protein